MLAVADEEGGVCLYDVNKQGPSAKLKGMSRQRVMLFNLMTDDFTCQRKRITMNSCFRLDGAQQCNI